MIDSGDSANIKSIKRGIWAIFWTLVSMQIPFMFDRWGF
jgi:hypothetical protein